VIPTVIMAGLLLGRWWWSVPVLAVGWGVLILETNDTVDPALFFGAAALGAANAAVGFLIHQGVRVLVVRPIIEDVRAARR
jgi:hypothetical protein